jgi:hypothetical protein
MKIALLMMLAMSDWVPLVWNEDASGLARLNGTPFNCLLVVEERWEPRLARIPGRVTLALVEGDQRVEERVRRALSMDFNGIALRGRANENTVKAVRRLTGNRPVVVLGARGGMLSGEGIAGTREAVWARLRPVGVDGAEAAPSGAPWIDTNAGYLKFVKALRAGPIWVSAEIPPDLKERQVLQMAADAGMAGAHWVVEGELARGRTWRSLSELVAFFETHRAVAQWPAYGDLAVLADVRAGALVTGGVLDMIAAKHTPMRTLPVGRFSERELAGARMAVDAAPGLLSGEEIAALKGFSERGGTVMSGGGGKRLAGKVKTDAKDVEELDRVWKEVNAMMGRRNLGARLFNVGSMLSNLVASPDGRRVGLFLVNYSDFPVDSITAHLLGKYRKATLYRPGREARALELFDNEDGVGVDVDEVDVAALVVLER